MSALEDISLYELQGTLDVVSEKTPAVRLVAAIAYKNGVTQTELSEWLDVERKTIYNWVTRIEENDDLLDAVTDAPRPGRPRKLDRNELEELKRDLEAAPDAVGVESDSWTPAVLQEHVEDQFDVEYSLPSCRRLLNELG